MNTLSRRMSTFALPSNKSQFRTAFKNHNQKRRMKTGKKILKAGAQLEQQREKQQSSFWDFPKKHLKLGIKKSSSFGDVTSVNGISKRMKNNPSVLRKAKKSIKRLEVEVAETRGYTKCFKELAMDEAKVLASAIEEMEAEANQRRKKNKMHSTENQIINHFITGMLAVFEAGDQHA